VLVNLVQELRRKLQSHGLQNTLDSLLLKALNRIFVLKILRGVCVEQADAAFLKLPQNYQADFLTADELRSYSGDPKTEISAEFLDEALTRGDQCYAIRDAGTLAAYGWYSGGRTPIGLGDLVLNFSRHYVYMYKGFTDARYRGQRLHAIGMTRALAHYLSGGDNGLVSYIEAHNFDSLKSCFRMGYRVFGSIYVVRIFGRYHAFSSPGCSRFSFRLAHAAACAPALTFGKN
jgi:hypothetical protein